MMDQDDSAGADAARTQDDGALARMASRHRLAIEADRAAFAAGLRVAFGRMAAECPGLDTTVAGVETRQAGLAEIIDMATPGCFLALLEGADEAMGLAMACPAVLTSVIEAQTTGAVGMSEPVLRKPTRTDAALIAPLIDAFLQQMVARAAPTPQGVALGGYAYGSYLDDPRPLGLMLEDRRYLLMELSVSFGDGGRQGSWVIALPQTTLPATATAESANAAQDWTACLAATVSTSPVALRAVLGRVALSLTEALRLRPGDVLRLPVEAIEALALESIAHEPVGIARLGQARGQRAVRLTADPGVLSDAVGASVAAHPLPTAILPFRPPQATFVPGAEADTKAAPGSAPDAPDTTAAQGAADPDAGN